MIESYGHQQSSRQHYPPLPQSHHRPPYSTQPSTSSSYLQHPQATPRGAPVQSVQKIHHAPHAPIQNHDEKLKTLTNKWIRENVIAEPGCMAVRGEMYAACVDYLRTVHGIMSGTVQFFTGQIQ